MMKVWKPSAFSRQLKALAGSHLRYASAAAERKPEDKNAPKESQSFVMSMFRGNLQTNQVFPFPKSLTSEEVQLMDEMSDPIRRFYQEVNNADANDKLGKIEDNTVAGLWDLGLTAMMVPPEYGGLGLGNAQSAMCGAITGQYDLAVAICIGSHQSIGYKGILLFGTPEQKQKYLPRVSTGKDFAAFCLTEPHAGSDAASIKTRAELSPDGKHYILNGSKIWISNGGFAEIMTVFAKTLVKDPVTGAEKDKITAFIVERGFGGVTSGPPEEKMGIKASNTTEVFYDNVKIPVENVLGGIGNGFKVAMNILNNGRCGMAAALSGTQKTCILKATEFATQRKQFGKTIENYGAIQEKLGRMATLQYVTESIGFMIAANMDLGSTEYHLESAIAKVFASEASWYVCDEAIQVLGGMGFMRGTGLEKILRDLRIFRIFEGANDILRLFIALNGIQHAGTHLKELQKALKNPTSNLGFVLAETQKRAFRSVGLGQTPSMTHLVHPNLNDAAHRCAKSVEQIGITVEKLLSTHGKNIVEQQFLLTRLGSAAIDTYTMVVVLSRATDSLNNGLQSASYEENMAKLWCYEASERVAQNCRSLESEPALNSFNLLSAISRAVCENGGVAQRNPYGMI